MEVLVTKSIEKELYKILSSQKSIDFFINKLKKKNIENIYIKRPFIKIKVSVFGLALRIIGEYRKVEGRLVLILILKKADKTYGSNLTWSKEIEHKVISILPKLSQDIKNLHYKIY